MSIGMHTRVDTGERGTRDASFVAFICPDILHYENAPLSYNISYKRITLLGMVSRWDSTLGFPGGMVEEGESLLQAAIREVEEEVGYTVLPEDLHPVCSHKVNGGLNSHLYVCKVTREKMYDIQRASLDAEHAKIEAGGFIVHHMFKDSFQNLIESSLAKSVREQLYTLDQLNYL